MTLTPDALAAQPRCVSNICPRFILEGTPRGFRTISTGVPSGMKGISSSGRILAIVPLLPCLPVSLSPTLALRFVVTSTFTTS